MSTPRQRYERPPLRGPDAVAVGARRPRPGRRRLLALGVLVAVAALGLRGADTSTAEEDATAVTPRPRAGADAGERQATAPRHPFAEVRGLVLGLTSADVLLVGFHEASREGALALAPIGRGRSNANTTRITLPEDREEGPDYHVMSSRGRTLPPTSAVDLVMRDDDPVLAPVDGTVVQVEPYHLYGTHPDTRIEIRPDDAPDLRVVLIHVEDVRVATGDRVTAGATALAGTANRFPFASHVDRYLDDRWPHVHLEVKAAP